MTMTGPGTRSQAPGDAVEFRTAQYERARAVFDSAGYGSADRDLAERLRAEFPRPSDDLRASVAAFRDMLRLEMRPERFRRLLRAWAGRVVAGIRSGDFVAAGAWMKALTENPVFPSEYSHHVTEAVRELSRAALLDELVVALAKAGDPPGAAGLLSGWGSPLVEYLIGGMLVEVPKVNRRHLVEYLGQAGRGDIRLLTPWLRDPRWYVVRNVATAIGRAGREGGVAALMSVIDHEDDRVRVEVIRALATLEGPEAVPLLVTALADPSQRVRNAAVSLLRAEPSDEVVLRIADHLGSATVTADDVRRLIKIIAERTSETARATINDLAERRSGRKVPKLVREAARSALGRPS